MDKEIMETFRKVEVNIPLLEAIKQIPKYAKFLKDLCTHRRRLKGNEKVSMGRNVSAIIQSSIPPKCKDPGTFTIPCIIGSEQFSQAMLDLGPSINVMPKSVYQSLHIGKLRPTGVVIQLANRSTTHPEGVLEDVLVRVNDLIFPTDFYVLNMENDVNQPTLILGRPFLKTAKTKIDVHSGTLSMEFRDNKVHFKLHDAIRYPPEEHSVFHLDIIDTLALEMTFNVQIVMEFMIYVLFVTNLTHGIYGSESAQNLHVDLGSLSYDVIRTDSDSSFAIVENTDCTEIRKTEQIPRLAPSIQEPPTLELKPLPENLKYVFLAPNEKLPVIIAQDLQPEQEEQLLNILRQNINALGWTLANIPRISPSTCMHRIQLEEGVKLVRQPQRRLSPLILVVVKKKFTLHLRIKRRQPSPVHSVHLHTEGCLSVYAMPQVHFRDACLARVLKRCVESHLVLNYEKCHFMVRQGVVLGDVISGEGIVVDSSKIDVIASLPYPTCVREVRSFLGHAGFYRRFIQDFSKITLPLSKLLQKDIDFQFDDECRRAFDQLKRHLISAPANYTTTEKELLAIIFALDKFRAYLLGTKVTVFSDHAALKFLLKKPDAKPRLIRWMLLLQEFDIEIKDKSGVENLTLEPLPIRENFPDKQLLELRGKDPWYADLVNYLVASELPAYFKKHQIEKLRSEAKYYVWDDPYL
ncbi:uncharacterized protein LOC113859603 [Abrus precatorius]|uniref:RNA-directed DNA polymerase n=1 Tax=Abrus precatorius TaxID=3816 RepID=A0A8B8KXQ0_ABRPR|nr:uncharacterized protein LOC113859603 [Abrus precatorius]